MFGINNPDLPQEISFTIFRYLPKKINIKMQSVNRDWLELLKDNLWEKSGATSYADFIARIKILPSKLQRLIVNDVYTLSLAEEINAYFNLNINERSKVWFNKLAEDLTVAEMGKFRLISSDNFFQAIKEKLFNYRDFEAFPMDKMYFFFVLSEHDILLDLLRDKKMTLEQIKKAPNDGNKLFLTRLLCPIILQYISADLFTVEAAISLPDGRYLSCLLNTYGCKALNERLISLEEIGEIKNMKILEALFSPRGLKFLRAQKEKPRKQIDFNELVTDKNVPYYLCSII